MLCYQLFSHYVLYGKWHQILYYLTTQCSISYDRYSWVLKIPIHPLLLESYYSNHFHYINSNLKCTWILRFFIKILQYSIRFYIQAIRIYSANCKYIWIVTKLKELVANKVNQYEMIEFLLDILLQQVYLIGCIWWQIKQREIFVCKTRNATISKYGLIKLCKVSSLPIKMKILCCKNVREREVYFL